MVSTLLVLTWKGYYVVCFAVSDFKVKPDFGLLARAIEQSCLTLRIETTHSHDKASDGDTLLSPFSQMEIPYEDSYTTSMDECGYGQYWH